MQSLLSIIVPVYKVEKYLTRCLDSIRRQSLKNIEILLIDDASPDRCGEICEQYAAKDKRFKVFHHAENIGLSKARNMGIRASAADYLMFVDSDDMVHEDFCKDAYECAVQNNADIVMFGYQRMEDSSVQKRPHTLNVSHENGFCSREDAIDLIFGEIGDYCWNKLYQKRIFDGIKFPEGFYYEDIGTTYKLIWRAETIYFLDKNLYYHYIRTDSITKFKTKKRLKDRFIMSIEKDLNLASWGYPLKKLQPDLQKISMLYCVCQIRDDSDSCYMFASEYLRKTEVTPAYFSWKRKTAFLLLKFCPGLFDFMCTAFGKHKLYI